ncbi:sialic acid-binding Ig-like lectin 5 [Polyodon spathula]|uniref:sialic acid-binding Ig-like lectin 5 n=1 Tax=Polyodon spathula TaxID=7913 RepID=UPI001B7DAE25|nr:sialic acid-binding Ig-like lectin 5 [Polyodon spathula]
MDSTWRFCLAGCLLQGIVLSVVCDAWTVTIPEKISALQGSCVVIPCNFSYSSNPPQSFVVVWYQYVSRGYPVVYDGRNPSIVIDKFRGRTVLVGDVHAGDCSLKIDSITRNDNGEKLYSWIDPDHISYRIYKFYDKTVELAVSDHADPPEISVLGTAVNGNSVRVTCSILHTCPASPPNFTWSYAGDSVSSHHESQSSGSWKSTSVLTLTTSRNDGAKELTCKVQHPGGKTASSIKLYAPKVVTVSMDNRPLKEGTTVILTCVTNGNPEPRHYQWLQIQGRKTIDLNNDAQHLEISNVRRGNVYSCTARNGLGSKTSEPVTLPVEYAPEIDMDSHCTFQGGAVACSCRAVAKPPASISWNIKGTSSRETLNISSTVNGNVVTGVLTGSLASQVNISCSATNMHGDTSYDLPFITGNNTFSYTNNASLSVIQGKYRTNMHGRPPCNNTVLFCWHKDLCYIASPQYADAHSNK